MKSEKIERSLPELATQELYRDMIDAYIASAPRHYQAALREMQSRVDAGHSLDESDTDVVENLSKLFQALDPKITTHPTSATR